MNGAQQDFGKCSIVAIAFALSLGSLVSHANDEPKEGPIWQTWRARVAEDKMDQYLVFLNKVYSHKLAAWKEAGLISDYKVLVAKPLSGDDWNIAFMYQYPNWAALDVPESEWEKVGNKALLKIKDEEAKKMLDEYHSWRKFLGWSQPARELVWTSEIKQ